MFNGSAWSPPADVDGSHTLNSVSCASRSFCVAVDQQGDALTFNGRSWSAPARIAGPNGELVSVSCAARAFCVAVGDAASADTGTSAGTAFVYGQARSRRRKRRRR
jgi:hypothetical protein